MKNFGKCMWKYSYYFLLEIVLSYGLASVVVKGNETISTAVDEMLTGKLVQFGTFLVYLLVLTGAGFLMAFVKSVAASKFAVKVQTAYKRMVAEKLYHLEYRYFDANGSASVINKMNSDIAEADALLNENLPEICTNAVSLVIYAVYIGQMNVRLLLLMLLCYPVILFFTNRVVKKIVNLKKVFRQKSDLITEIAQDCISGILVLRSFGAEKYFEDKLDLAADELVNNEEKRTRISNTAIIVRQVLQWLPNIICAVYAYVLVRGGNLSIGELLAFVVILERFVSSFVGLPFNFVDAKEHLVCIRRVEKILGEKNENSGVETCGLEGDAIVFDKVAFAYGEGNEVLKELSFAIPTGTSAAFVGDSGGGKSTIFRILCGFYPVTAGSYRLFGRELAQWDIQAAREQMALVSQNVFLFPGTIEENVAYGNRKASKEEIIQACKSARIHEFIMSQPEGYATVVGERGILLSGGERQRISIARAILKDAPILLLDEPTSAVDVETEALIQEAIDQLSANRTTIIIAHRLSTVRNVDKIMVLKDGRVVETGTHTELMTKQGAYAAMYGREEEETTEGENPVKVSEDKNATVRERREA